MKRGIFFMVALTLLFATYAMGADKIVSLATTEWEPYVGEKMKNYGFTSEIIAEAFKRVGYDVIFSFKPPKRVMADVEAGLNDAGYPAYYSDERARRFDYSEPFAEGPLGFYKRKDLRISYTTLRDLAPYKIGVCLGFAYPKEFDGADYLEKEVARDEKANIRKLLRRRIDLFITDKFAAKAAINKFVPEGNAVLEFMEPPLELRKLHLIFGRKEGNKKKMEDFNTGLRMILEDGTVTKIMERHGF
ncbi:MAG: transporter substrate-binding domain-containing protein [Pseudomonadota bacterium]